MLPRSPLRMERLQSELYFWRLLVGCRDLDLPDTVCLPRREGFMARSGSSVHHGSDNLLSKAANYQCLSPGMHVARRM